MLIAKAAYAQGRKKVSQEFMDLIKGCIAQVHIDKDLDVFANFFESFMGFYRQYRANKEEGNAMQLINIKEIKGKVILKSGLHIGAGDTHRHTDVGPSERRSIVHTITGHGHVLALVLKRANDLELLFRSNARVDSDLLHTPLEVL